MDDIEQRTLDLRRDGFVRFQNLLPPDLVVRAHAELTAWCAEDLKDRAHAGNTECEHRGAAGRTRYLPTMHLLVDVFGISPALDSIMEAILTHPLSAGVLERTTGKHVKLRGYNVRVMSGAHDPAPANPGGQALEWHRDSPGEIGITMVLSDVPDGGNGGTAVVRGSHLYPYDPRWHTLFSPNWHIDPLTAGVPAFARWNIFSRLLARKAIGTRATEAGGNAGDFYYFLNDTWHGRYPNLHGRKSMIILVGLFATECPYPDTVTPPPAAVLEKLPPRFRAAVAQTDPPNTASDTVLKWMLANRMRLRLFGWFFWARFERVLVSTACRVGRKYTTMCIQLYWRMGRVGKRVLRRLLGTAPPQPASVPATADEQPQKAA